MTTTYYQASGVDVSMRYSQMQRRIVSFVDNIDSCPSLNKQLHNLVLPILSCPMQRTEAVIVPAGNTRNMKQVFHA